MSLVLILPKGLNLPQINIKLWADTKYIYITKHFTILHVVQETGCKFQVETIQMGLTWSFTSNGKIFYNFSQIFFHKDLFQYNSSWFFCVLCSLFTKSNIKI